MFIIIDFASIISGAGLAIGIILWLILVIFGKGIADQGVVVGNLCTSILFLIGAIISLVKMFKEGEKAHKILGVIGIVALVCAMIYGLAVPYNNQMFKYSYERWASAIHTTWIVALIINLIEMIMIESDAFAGIYGSIVIFIMGLFIGQFLTMGLWLFTGIDNTRAVYNSICYYDNKNYENSEKNKFENVAEMANFSLDNYKKDLEEKGMDNSAVAISNSLNTSSEFRENYLQEYGYDCRKCQILLTNNLKYIIVDMQSQTLHEVFFDAKENKFVEYKKEEVIEKENQIANDLLEQFKKIAIDLAKRKEVGYPAGEYVTKNYSNGIIENFGLNVNIGNDVTTVSFNKNGGNTTFDIEINSNNFQVISAEYKLAELY